MYRVRYALMLGVVTSVLLECSVSHALDDNNALFKQTTDPQVISRQIRLALPAARRGFELLQTASSQEETAIAVESIYDSYRYLRAAEESSENLQAWAKVKDPLTKLRNDHIWQIRLHLRFCRDNGGSLADAGIRATCTQGLVNAIRDLQVIVETTP